MAKKKSNRTAEALRDLEASGDRITEWASEHAALILGIMAGVLVLAAGVGLWVQLRSNARDEAVNALAVATHEYRIAMGADPSGGLIPEPANAELAERTRSRFAQRFEKIGRTYSGSAVGALGMLEAGELEVQLGKPDAAAIDFEVARDGSQGSAIEALAAIRLAGLAEARGDMQAAAKAFESAAEVRAYPLRADALADAARCWAGANDIDRALATYQRLEAEFPDDSVSPPIKALLEELRIRSQSES